MTPAGKRDLNEAGADLIIKELYFLAQLLIEVVVAAISNLFLLSGS